MEPEPEVYTDSGDRKSFTKLKTKYGRNPPIKGEECDFQKYRKDNDEAVHTILDMMSEDEKKIKMLEADVGLIKDTLGIRNQRGKMKKKKSNKSKKRSKKRKTAKKSTKRKRSRKRH
jgi:hypothetical protein